MSNKSRGQRAETALRAILQERGYLVIRSAASKVYDLVCVDEGGYVFFLEVKSIKTGDTFRTSRTATTREQHVQMLRDAERYGSVDVWFLYAVRFPDGEYRLYHPEVEIMSRRGGMSLDYVFPVRITPNKPPIAPQTYAPSPPTGFEPMNSTSDVRQVTGLSYPTESQHDRDGVPRDTGDCGTD